MKVSGEPDSKQPDQVAASASSVAELSGGLDDTLVQRCVAGEHQAWRAFHRLYYPVAAAFLRKLGTREPELEDAVQEVFVQLFRYLPSFRQQAELKTWLYKLCITEARRVRRRSKLSLVISRLLHQQKPDEAVPAATMTEESALARVQATLDCLSEGERLVFVLYEMEGLPGKQIAELAKCPEATVWRRLHYARRTFRRALGEDDQEHAS
jgi:RNA polymerase sigma-70 factor (ECF subfamily)